MSQQFGAPESGSGGGSAALGWLASALLGLTVVLMAAALVDRLYRRRPGT